jgi:uncharacterized membrane protein
MKNFLFRYCPYIIGLVVLFFLIWINSKFNLSFRNIKGLDSVFESVIGFLSIVIGFYSAFYGMIISMTKSKFMTELKKSKYKNELPKLLISSLMFSFGTLILTVIMQVLVNYENTYITYIFYIWGFLLGIVITYALQTSLLSISMIFFSEPVEKKTKAIRMHQSN